MRKATILLLSLAVFALFVQTAETQRPEGPSFRDVQFANLHVQDDTAAAALESPAILLKYVGALESGTVDINVNALELFSGALASEDNAPSDSSDVNTGDVCGTANNALDVTDTDCDTPRELVNVINDSGAPWVAVLLGVDGDETLVAADYIDPADAQAGLEGGYALVLDASAEDQLAALLVPHQGSSYSATTVPLQQDIEPFLDSAGSDIRTQALLPQPFGNRRAVLNYVNAVVDSTSAWTLTIYAVKYIADGRRLERIVYETSATADDTEEILDFLKDAPLVSRPGETFLVQVTDDALVTAIININGYFLPSN